MIETGDSAAAVPCDENETGADCPPLVYAFGVRKATGHPLTWEEVKAGARAAEFDWLWIHLNVNSDEAAQWARAQDFMPGAAAEALFAMETRPRMTRFDGGVAVNLRGVNHNPGAEPEDMVSLRIWADAKRVVTARRRVVKAIADVRAIIERPNSGPRDPGEFVALLASKITNAIEPYVEEVTDAIDELEDVALEENERNIRARLADARRTAVQLRRYVAPQRDAINSLSLSDVALFDARTRLNLRETSDAVTRMTEEIDAARERAMILHEQIMDQRSETMNRNMLILATATAVFLPLQFIVGLLGINVAGIPGAHSPLAFWVVVGVSLSIGAAMIGFFRARGWI
ncbi:MAG: zinc transporter ZntB [Parvularculaceae bacterium]